jgi:hypothetical protein
MTLLLLAAIVARLRADAPVAPAAVARLRALLADGDGPLYTCAKAGTLRAWALALLAELDGPHGIFTPAGHICTPA